MSWRKFSRVFWPLLGGVFAASAATVAYYVAGAFSLDWTARHVSASAAALLLVFGLSGLPVAALMSFVYGWRAVSRWFAPIE